MKWISISRVHPSGAVVISSHLGETRRYLGDTPREAEQKYREEFGLRFTPLAKIND